MGACRPFGIRNYSLLSQICVLHWPKCFFYTEYLFSFLIICSCIIIIVLFLSGNKFEIITTFDKSFKFYCLTTYCCMNDLHFIKFIILDNHSFMKGDISQDYLIYLRRYFSTYYSNNNMVWAKYYVHYWRYTNKCILSLLMRKSASYKVSANWCRIYGKVRLGMVWKRSI